MKKTLTVLLCLAISLAMVFAGGEGESKSKVDQITFKSGWTLAEAAAPWKGETLHFIGEALPPLAALNEVKSEFEAITGVKVSIEQYGQEEVNQKTTADFVGKTGIYDLVLGPHRQMGTYVENGWLYPMNAFMDNAKLRDPGFDLKGDGVLDQRWWEECCWYQGNLYAFPFDFIAMYTWYRIDIFENPIEQKDFKAKYGYELPSPPITTQQLLDTSEFFTRKKGELCCGTPLTNDLYGITLMGKRHISTWYDVLNALYIFGAREITADHGYEYGTITINSPKAIEALKYYKELCKYCPPGLLATDWDTSQANMQQGITVLGWEWDDAVAAVENSSESVCSGKIAYSGLPIAPDGAKAVGIEGWNYLIPKNSKKPELAWLFLQWAMGRLVQKEQMLNGGQSGVTDVYNDPEILALNYTPTAVYLKTGGRTVLNVRKSGDASANGVPETYINAINPLTGDTSVTQYSKPTVPEQQEISDAILLMITRILSEEQTVEQAANDCAAKLKDILGSKVK
jgi:multiple sugar transport system substrate-binding protein